MLTNAELGAVQSAIPCPIVHSACATTARSLMPDCAQVPQILPVGFACNSTIPMGFKAGKSSITHVRMVNSPLLVQQKDESIEGAGLPSDLRLYNILYRLAVILLHTKFTRISRRPLSKACMPAQ